MKVVRRRMGRESGGGYVVVEEVVEMWKELEDRRGVKTTNKRKYS